MPKPVEAARYGPLRAFVPEVAARPVSLTAADLTAVRARFGRRLPGSPWCGFATWEESRLDGRQGSVGGRYGCRTRLSLFTLIEGRRQLTVMRYDDGSLALRNERGSTLATGRDVDALIAAVEHP